MWDERFSSKAYAYGTAPNQFLEHNFTSIPKGKVLSLAEGEGRNAVFLAKQGYSVTAVDSSKVGLEKAQNLAFKNGVEIECVHADLADFVIEDDYWDGIVSIFCPLPPNIRQALHKKVIAGLKPGGVFLLEAYTPEQLKYDTGGGKSAELMMSKQQLAFELEELDCRRLVELEREVVEGDYHTGIGAVVQAIAIKESDREHH